MDNNIYAHISKGVIYNIDDKSYDEKSDKDVLISNENSPKLVFTFSSSTSNSTFTKSLKSYISDGDFYDETQNKFSINHIDKDNITSFFSYAQFLEEQKHVEDIISNKNSYVLPFYFNAPNGEYEAKSNNEFNLPNGKYSYSYEIQNDGENKFVEHNISRAVVDVANQKAYEIIEQCGFRVKENDGTCNKISTDSIEIINIETNE